MQIRLTLSALVVLSVALSGCTTAGGVRTSAYAAPQATLKVCSGYGCQIADHFSLSENEFAQLATILKAGETSPAEERAAIAEAVGWFERTARRHLKYQADEKKAYQRNIGKRGQMDCVDESLNTTVYLSFMQARGLLKHHRVRGHYAERGLIVDGRYPHKSAVIREKGGREWSVDSWYDANGERARIMPLAEWRQVRDSFSLG